MYAFLEAELSQLYHGEDNTPVLEAIPQICSKSPLDDFQMDFVKLDGKCGESFLFFRFTLRTHLHACTS